MGDPAFSDLKSLSLLDPLADNVGTSTICAQSPPQPWPISLPISHSVKGSRLWDLLQAPERWAVDCSFSQNLVNENCWLKGMGSAVVSGPCSEEGLDATTWCPLRTECLSALRTLSRPWNDNLWRRVVFLRSVSSLAHRTENWKFHRSQGVWDKNSVFANMCKLLVQSTDRKWDFLFSGMFRDPCS